MEDLHQYEISFPNEYTKEIVNKIAEIMNIEVNNDYLEKFIPNRLKKMTSYIAIFANNSAEFIIVDCTPNDILNNIIVRCKNRKKIINEMLLELDNKYRKEYGQVLSLTVENRINNENTLLNSCLKYHKITLEELLDSVDI